MKNKLTVVICSVRVGRRGEKVANWFREVAENDGRFEITIADLADYNLPLRMEFTEPSEYKDKKYPDSNIQQWSDVIDSSEAFIFVIPEYNHAMPASLKNAIDHIYYEWIGKPVGFVGYGSHGAADSIDSLRHTATALKWQIVQPIVGIQRVKRAFDDQDNLIDDGHYLTAAKQMLNALAKIA